ncbi:MAG: N-acetylmuramoyl-L-alanine amidase [Nitrospirae bacterium]|nr:N-acetylmuramoyl-L-alanine amidase [Nitrospirota bacterium]
MKTILISLLLILSVSTAPAEEAYSLRIKASNHPDFLRIVIEGADAIISKALVNQKGRDIIVRFPDTRFSVREASEGVSNKTLKDAILFSPGDFNEFKVSRLKDPSRLVVDIFPPGKKNNEAVTVKEQAKDSRLKIILIDPGHGGYDSGIIAGDYREKNVVLDISKTLALMINKGTSRCFLTRESDLSISLGERAKFTNSKNADIFISLHIGKHSGMTLYLPVITEPAPPYVSSYLINRGQEEYMDKTDDLSKSMQTALKEDFGDLMVTLKPLPYTILAKIEAAALIIELPTLTDARYNDEYKAKLANAIYKGLDLNEQTQAK